MHAASRLFSWSSWHLQVACLHLECWTIYICLFNPFFLVSARQNRPPLEAPCNPIQIKMIPGIIWSQFPYSGACVPSSDSSYVPGIYDGCCVPVLLLLLLLLLQLLHYFFVQKITAAAAAAALLLLLCIFHSYATM